MICLAQALNMKNNNCAMKCFIIASFMLILTNQVYTTQGCSQIRNLTNFKLRMQQKVELIRDQLIKKYKKTCDPQIMSCVKKTYDLCTGTGPVVCLTNYPALPSCFTPGVKLSQVSGARIPNIFDKNNLNGNLKKFICASALIQQTFQQLVTNNSIQYSYAYIGSSSGAIRVSPSFRQQLNITTGSCVNYDPRRRPWYVSAITGSKNTLILLDISKTMTSMHPGVRFINAKVTLSIIFQTLNSFDYVGVVVFSKTARTLVFNNIVNANDNNKNKILAQIQKLDTQQGTTNYTAAFQTGISMFADISTQCQSSLILLLTDGYTDSDSINNVTFYQDFISNSLKKINKSQNDVKLVSFVYGVQNNINYTLVKQLTCAYSGIVFRMWDGIDYFTMIQKLTSYYIFVSEGIDGSTIKPVWSDFYLDAFGFGNVISVTVPIYLEGQVNNVIGVAAIDVLLSKFQQCGYNLTFIQSQLSHKPQCFKSTLQPNQLQYLRCRQGNLTCTLSVNNCNQIRPMTPDEICDQNITSDIFQKYSADTSYDSLTCCSITINQFIIIISCIFVAIIIIIATVVLYKKGIFKSLYEKYQTWKNRSKPKIQSQDGSNQSLIGDRNLIYDPLKKYKEAQQKGIKIYRQPQFIL